MFYIIVALILMAAGAYLEAKFGGKALAAAKAEIVRAHARLTALESDVIALKAKL